MRIAITSQNRKTVTEHAGQCRKFWVYTAENGQIIDRQLLELTQAQSFHESSPRFSHPLDHVNVLITGSLGGELHNRLAQKGIQTIVTRESDPEQAVRAFLDGSLECLPIGAHQCDHHH
jgi:predicted Fe-Mo cluster-binding NifX family protein